jgi:hypothetical protein
MALKPSAHSRRQLELDRRTLHQSPGFDWRSMLRADSLLTNLVRLGFLLLVVGVLSGVWVVARAHLTEQLLGAPEETAGLIDPTAGQNALTPEYIERQALAFSLRLREPELAVVAGRGRSPSALANPHASWPLGWQPKALSLTPISLTSICA